ncbi:MAG: efflux RND transporter permease subunit, partial [Planctomycetota bacterium]
MNLAGYAMRFRPVVITFVTLLAIWGAITFQTMPRREDPEFTIRSCVVSTRWPGASAIKVEELITDKIEEAVDSIEEVETVRSTTINGLSTVYVDVEDRVTADTIANVWDKVRAKVELVQLPSRDIRPVVNDDFGDTSILLLGVFQVPLEGEAEVNSDYRYTPRQLEDYADQVRDVLRLLPGVAKVEKFGVQDEAIFIETDLGTWSKVALTTGSLRQLVEARNIVLPGGTIDTSAGKFSVKPGGEFDAVSEIRSLPVAASESDNSVNLVTLSDIGLDVNRDYKQPSEVLCNFTDERGTFPAIMIGVTMKSGANIIDVCERSLERVKELVEIDQSLPRDIDVKPVSNQADNVSMKINDVISNVVSAVVIVVIVVLLFVGLRTSLVMAANIPIVVLSAVALIAVFGVQLEQISLASIIIALGLLVDNAVQVCDQTRTNLLAGMKPREAAVEGAKVLALPMLTGTLTTVAAFFPMLFALQGGGKEYVYSLPVTLSTTLLLSWMLAMTVCVILAAMFIRPPKDPDRPSAPLPWLGAKLAELRTRMSKGSKKSTGTNNSKSDNADQNLFLKIYGWTAIAAIKAKWVTVAISIGLLIACMSLPVSSEFFPQDRRDQFFVNVILPETATIEQTKQVVEQVESTVRGLSASVDESGNAIERLRSMRSMMGKGGARWALGVDPPSPNSNVAEILVRTTDGALTPQYIADLRRVTSEGDAELGIEPVVGARVIPKKLALGPPAAPLVLRVAGDGFADIEELRRIARDVKDLVRDQPETWDVNDSWG